MKEVSIVIINYNSSKYTINCIESLKNNETLLNYEIIVVDNNSRDDEKLILKKYFKDLINCELILNDKNIGFGQANNIGVLKAKSEYVLLLNTDTLVIKPFLKQMLKIYKENSEIGALGMQLKYFDGRLQASAGYFPCCRQEIFELIPARLKNKYRRIFKPLAFIIKNDFYLEQVDYVSGALMLIKKDTFIKSGGFSSKIFMYFEETELCKRIYKAGMKTYMYNGGAVLHKGGGSIGAFSEFKAECFAKGKKHFIYNDDKSKEIIILSIINAIIKRNIYYLIYIINNNSLNFQKFKYWNKIIMQFREMEKK